MIVIIICITLSNIFCFYIGAKINQQSEKNIPIEIPIKNPINAVKTAMEQKQKQEYEKLIEEDIENIDNYGLDEIDRR